MKHNALLFGASGGLGQALNQAMRNSPYINELICFSRSNDSKHHFIDYENEQSIIDASAFIEKHDLKPTLILIASGLLSTKDNRPETQISQFSVEWAQKNYLINAIGPALIAKYFLPLMPRNQAIFFGALSAKVGSISDNRLGGWHSYRASKSALNMLIKNLAIEWKRKNKESRILGLHPGTVDTNLSKPYQKNVAKENLFSPEYSANQLLKIILDASPEQSGELISWNGAIITP